MSKFLSGRQSNLKLGVAGYTESKTVLETTGKVGIGTTDAQQHSLFVVGSTNITGDTTVGSAITMYASTGIVSATAFYGDGSNLENTGATLSAAAGTQRLVVTSLTSGTMVDAATDSDLTYNATTDTLNVENIDVDGHTELDQLRVTGVSTFAGNVDISSNGNLTVAGNLIVQGTETRLNTTVLEVEDINIGIASVTPTLSDAALDGAGITIHGSQGDKTLTWSNANSRMEFNTDVNVANLKLDDTQKAFFGDGDDLRIYHTGAASFIEQTGTGPLNIKQATDDADVVIQSDNGSGGTVAYFRADGSSGESRLYYYGSQKFATKSDGIDVTGHIETDTLRVSGVSTFQDNVDLGDDDRLRFGDSQDLQIYHDGSNSYIVEDGAGLLNIDSSYLRFRNVDGSKTFATFTHTTGVSGGVQLYYNGFKKFETTSYGVKIYDDLNVGTGVTIYGNAGIVSATSFFGDGSNLTNTGATLSATSGVERLVTTQLTSGTMVDAATDADLTFNAGTNTLAVPNIAVVGFSSDGANYGNSGFVPVANGAGGWTWTSLQGASSVNTILNGFTVSEEGVVVGTAGSITQLDFRGVNITASANPAPNGIATVSVALNQSLDELNVSGIATFGGQISAGGTTGTDGQYLKSTGVGVTWASFPTLRTTQTTSASANQTVFNFTYNVNFLDVFVNGVKLTSSEYTANNGSQITLNTPAFASDVVEFHSYNTVSTGSGGGGGGGASNLTGLSDVNFPISLADNQLLQYNSSTSVWENVAVTSLPYATEAFVGLATAGLLSSTGDASNLSNLTGASAATYGSATTVPQIVIDSNGRITGITNVAITGGGGGGTSIIVNDSGSLVGTAGTIDFGTGLSVTPPVSGIVTVTADFDLTDLSVTTANTPLQLGALSYNNSNGVFTFTPPDIVGQARPGFSVGPANSPLQVGAISYASTSGVFTYTPPDLSSYLTSYTETDPVVGAVNGIVKADGNGTISAATAGTDYLTPTGDGSGLTGITTTTAEWTLGANSINHYTFTGPGVAPATDDPTIYLVRGQKYLFKNRSGGHPFRIQYEYQNTGGTAYNDGITNNGAGNGTDLYWEVRNDAPDLLHYQCTSHQNMSGRIVILGDIKTEGSWTATSNTLTNIDTITGIANNAIKTAEYTIHIQHPTGMQSQKVLVMQDGSAAYSQEYAIMNTTSNPLVSIGASVHSGNLYLNATPATGVNGITTYTFTRQTIR